MPRVDDITEQLRMALGGTAAKRAYRDQRKAERRERRALRRRQFKCFWSFPLRHEFPVLEREDGSKYKGRCVGCGKPY